MLELLWLVPALPLAGFVMLILRGSRLPRSIAAGIGVGSVGLSALVTLVVFVEFLSRLPENAAFTQTLWTWLHVAGFSPTVSFYLDSFSMVMVLVVTVVGFLIHLYSAGFMVGDEHYSRFFAYMNLFVAAMLVLVLADNLMLLYLGWEGVGLCSYLLIGFWFRERENARAAMKAFVVTRIGDTGMIVGLLLLFNSLGTLQIQDLMHRAVSQWPEGSGMAVLAAGLLLCGAVGKSAQVPLQTWLPDAMAGPTPVSALIHAATMVTAGVYLIARTHVLFTLAPEIQAAVAVIGTVTLLLAGFSALAQVDIKRVLAYSTMSQIGYMFLALGVGAWSAAMFHFVTHAFFKSLLFLAAGAIIHATDHEQNLFRLGGLRTRLPVVFWTFLAGAACLSALPLVSAGFYSKDLILWYAWSSDKGSPWLWLGGTVGAFVTAVYTFRMVFLAFFGEIRTGIKHMPGPVMHIPLIVLAIGALGIGFIELPHTIGNTQIFSRFVASALPAAVVQPHQAHLELVLQVVCGFLSLAGVYVAYMLFLKLRQSTDLFVSRSFVALIHRFLLGGWGFDVLYHRLLVRPFIRLAAVNRNDVVDRLYLAVAAVTEALYHGLSLSQSGRVRNYAVGVGLGATAVVALVVWL